MRISKVLVIAAAVAVPSAVALFSKPVMAEKAMASASDSAAFAAKYPTLAALKGAARERALSLAEKMDNTNYHAFGAVAPAKAQAREEEATREVSVPEPASTKDAGSTGAADALYDKVNKYADLTEKERADLGKDVQASGDEGLVSLYNSTRAAYFGKAPAKSAETEAPKKEVKQETGETPAAAIGGNAGTADVDALYDRVNKYADLTQGQREELGREVQASGDEGLVSFYNSTKAAYPDMAGSNVDKTAAKDNQAAETGEKVPETPVEIEKPGERKKESVETSEQPKTPVETLEKPAEQPKASVEAPQEPVKKEISVPQKLKDSLDATVDECYKAINAMAPGTLAEDSARIAGTIAELEAIIAKKFPKGDAWGEYTLAHLKQYFEGYCRALGGKKE